MEISCKTRKFVNPKGKILGTAEVFFETSMGELKLGGFKIMQGSTSLWVSMPSESWEKNGKKEYRDTVELPDELKAQVCLKILATWNPPVPAAA